MKKYNLTATREGEDFVIGSYNLPETFKELSEWKEDTDDRKYSDWFAGWKVSERQKHLKKSDEQKKKEKDQRDMGKVFMSYPERIRTLLVRGSELRTKEEEKELVTFFIPKKS